jgi:uncharacterized delta-60 repeat protein
MIFEPGDTALVSGSFHAIGGLARRYVARLRNDGAVDRTFAPEVPLGRTNYVDQMLRQPSGEIIIASVTGEIRQLLPDGTSRLRATVGGSTDLRGPGYVITTGPSLLALNAAPAGKVLVGGWFRYIFNDATNMSRRCLARLHPDGSPDPTFEPSLISSNPSGDDTVADYAFVDALGVQKDGTIYISGRFTNVGGLLRARFARLQANGRVDPDYTVRLITSQTIPSLVRTIVVQPDDKIVLAGDFTGVLLRAVLERNRIARLNADGTLDTSFDPGMGADGTIRSVALLPSGKLLIGGDFTNYAGVRRMRMARLNANGRLDESFDPGTGASGPIYAISVGTDGRIGIGGSFASFNNVPRQNVAILYPLELLRPLIGADGSFRASFLTLRGHSYTLEFKDSLVSPDWTKAETFRGDGAVREFLAPLRATSQGFYRVRVDDQ